MGKCCGPCDFFQFQRFLTFWNTLMPSYSLKTTTSTLTSCSHVALLATWADWSFLKTYKHPLFDVQAVWTGCHFTSLFTFWNGFSIFGDDSFQWKRWIFGTLYRKTKWESKKPSTPHSLITKQSETSKKNVKDFLCVKEETYQICDLRMAL